MASALDRHEFEQALGDGEGQGRLVCCSPWGRQESNTAEWLNNKEASDCNAVFLVVIMTYVLSWQTKEPVVWFSPLVIFIVNASKRRDKRLP